MANHNRYSGVELSKLMPTMAHDSVSRWLGSQQYSPRDLWAQVKPLVSLNSGYLVCDDTLLNKQYSRVNELARRQDSGNAHGLVNGINLVNLLWTDGPSLIPVDYRIYDRPTDGLTKNDHFQHMLSRAQTRGFSPQYVLMDSWYSSIENLKFICNLKSNRVVSRNRVPCAISDLSLADKQVMKVWLKAFGHILVCTVVATNGDRTYLATNDLSLEDYDQFTNHFQQRWNIEEFHRGIKQTTGIEQCYSVKAQSQKTHIFASFVSFVRLETRRLRTHISWYEQKASIPRIAVRSYLLMANA